MQDAHLSSQNANNCMNTKNNPRLEIVGGSSCKIKAHAKINLLLDIINKRSDGYHNIKTIMQQIKLHDTVYINIKKTNDLCVNFLCSDSKLNKNNLCEKAANLMIEKYNISSGIDIFLKKDIPIAAGLGGGSSDAAAVITGINELFELNLRADELIDTAKNIGADVPYFIYNKTALAEGIGEILTPLPAHPDCYIVLACLETPVSTKEIFEKLDLSKINKRPNFENAIKALSDKNLENISKELTNIFDTVTKTLHMEINMLQSKLDELGAVGSCMSGTGSAVYGYFCDKEKAKQASSVLKNITKIVHLTKIKKD